MRRNSSWKAGSCRASSYAAVSCSMANMSVSGTYRPPYGPNRPRASGRVCVAAVAMGALWVVPEGARLLCRFGAGISTGLWELPHRPAERGDGEDDWVQLLEVPQLGEVEADGRGIGEG